MDVTIYVMAFWLLFGSGTMTIDCEVEVVVSVVEAAGEGTEEVDDVTGDGVDDEVDCSSTSVDVDVEITVDEDGGELDGRGSEGKENGVEVEVDIVTGIETIICQNSPYWSSSNTYPVRLSWKLPYYENVTGRLELVVTRPLKSKGVSQKQTVHESMKE